MAKFETLKALQKKQEESNSGGGGNAYVTLKDRNYLRMERTLIRMLVAPK